METGKMKKIFVLLIISLLFYCAVPVIAEQIYYDIDFSSPLHIVGQVPTVDNSPETISRITSGNPIVVESYGQLTDQPLLFNTEGNSGSFYYDQVSLDMNRQRGNYYISFDLLTHNLIGSSNSFSAFVDNPYAGGISFHNNGRMYFGNINLPFWDDTLMHIEIMPDFQNNNYRIQINGQTIWNNEYYPNDRDPEDYFFSSLRFSLGSASYVQDNSTYAAIDNIYIADYIIPEPATLSLLALGGLLLRKRK